MAHSVSRKAKNQRKYLALNIKDRLGHGMVKLHFVRNSWPNTEKIYKRLRFERTEDSRGRLTLQMQENAGRRDISRRNSLP